MYGSVNGVRKSLWIVKVVLESLLHRSIKIAIKNCFIITAMTNQP